MSRIKITALAGSLRKDAYSKKLFNAFEEHAPKGVELTLLDYSKLPLSTKISKLPSQLKQLLLKKRLKQPTQSYLSPPNITALYPVF